MTEIVRGLRLRPEAGPWSLVCGRLIRMQDYPRGLVGRVNLHFGSKFVHVLIQRAKWYDHVFGKVLSVYERHG